MDADDTRRLVPHAGRCCDLEDGEAATENRCLAPGWRQTWRHRGL